MNIAVVGLGVQGRKRYAVTAQAGDHVAATVDPVLGEAQFRCIEEVPPASFDAAFVCTPDAAKIDLVRGLLEGGKHVLVEKPLLAEDQAPLRELARIARRCNLALYTAYNHRFEPHIERLRDILSSGALGEIYAVRLFYGNGTARSVHESPWRDSGTGVLGDLGSHLLDVLLFWFDKIPNDLSVITANRFENAAFDHVVAASRSRPYVELEMSLVSWSNSFTADVFGAFGSAHIQSLCKWGPSTFVLRTRVVPDGRPAEETTVIEEPDPTWRREHIHFRALCSKGASDNTENDIAIMRTLANLGREAMVPRS